jgi:hypothetical protein
MAGEIMRVLDDSLVFYLMEKYSGYSLSPEAILALLGNTMGTSVINNIDPNNTMTLDQLQRYAELHPSEPLPSTSDYFNQMDYEMEMMMADQQQSSSLMKDTGNASLTAQLSYSSQINNYRSFGRRSPPTGAGGGGTGIGGGKDLYSSHLPSLVGSSSLNSESGMSFARHGLNSRMNAPVTGFQPRSDFPHDSRVSSANNNNNNQLKTLAGGFLTQQGAALLQTLQLQKEGSFDPLPNTNNDQSHPWFTNRSSPYPGETGRKTPLVVLSSEHFRSVADEMGFSLPELMTTGFRDIQDQQEAADEREYQDQQKIESAIGAMHEQLLEEGILPSLRPEKVLSKQQLTELGLKKKTVEEVFKQITGKDIRAVLSRAPTTRADEIKAKLARNNTMSASQLSLINDLLELDKEQQSQQSHQQQQQQQSTQTAVPSISVDGFNDEDDSTTRGKDSSSSPSVAPLPAPLTSSPLPVTPSFKRALTLGSLHSIKEVKSTDSQDDFHHLPLHKSSSSGPGGGGHLLGRGGTGSRSNDETKNDEHEEEQQEKTISDSLMSENNNNHSRPNSKPELRKSFTTPSSLLFHGSILSTPKDKERLEKLQIAESEKATQRLILPAARDPREKYKELLEEFPLIKESIEQDMEREKQRLMKSIHSNRRGSNNSQQQQEDNNKDNKDKSSSSKDKNNNKKNKKMTKEEFLLSKEFKEEKDQFPQKGTRSIKTREDQDQQVEERRTALNQTKHTSSSSVEKDRGEGGGIDNIGDISHDNRLPANPYNSWDQETQILNAGVASGAGLMLWRPRTLATGDGRYRVGRNHHSQQGTASPIRPLPREGYSPLPNNNIGYLGVIHADNIYSKSKNRKTPFVSAT